MKDSPSDRFGNFFSRVETEREVMGVVNSKFGHFASLHGLTEVAINQWKGRLLAVTEWDEGIIKEIVNLLHRISVRADAKADQSRVVFDDEPSQSLPIFDLIGELRMACESIGVQRR